MADDGAGRKAGLGRTQHGSPRDASAHNGSAHNGSERLRRAAICDADQARAQVVAAIVAAAGLQPGIVSEGGETSTASLFSIAVVAIVTGENGQPTPACLSAIARFHSSQIVVIAYADGIASWPIGIRCRLLLAGARHLLDPAAAAFDELLSAALIVEAAEARQSHEEARQLRQIAREHGIVGDSSAMLGVVRQIARFSQFSDLPVLVTGESGTGKELVANAIRALDPARRERPFVPVNCAAITATLAESELFGNLRGAFTGAVSPRKGYFLAANRGTLFLDEIGELNLDLQAKLLRVIEERQVWQVGADRPLPVDVRVVAATNRDIPEMVKAGRFREDLFYRLNILAVKIPPLRERHEDLRPMAEHFLEVAAAARETVPREIEPELIDALALLPLAGNARELRSLMLLASATKPGNAPLGLSDLPPDLWRELSRDAVAVSQVLPAEPFMPAANLPDAAFPLRIVQQHAWKLSACLAHCEREIVEAALHEARYNQSQAARLLGLTPRTIYNKLRKYSLPGGEVPRTGFQSPPV